MSLLAGTAQLWSRDDLHMLPSRLPPRDAFHEAAARQRECCRRGSGRSAGWRSYRLRQEAHPTRRALRRVAGFKRDRAGSESGPSTLCWVFV